MMGLRGKTDWLTYGGKLKVASALLKTYAEQEKKAPAELGALLHYRCSHP